MAIDLSRSLRPLLETALDRASRHQQAGRFPDAADALEEAARLARQFAETAQTNSEKQRRMKSAIAIEENAQRLRRRSPSAPVTSLERPEIENSGGGEEAAQHRASARALIHRSAVTWDDIAGLSDTKRAIQAAYALSLAQAPHGVKLSPIRNVLFFGPPGCGKSLMAAATSRGLDATFFNVKVSSLLSKYFGEASKLITALYDEARQSSPSVIFLDEVDALTGHRDSGDSGAERRMLANLLAEMDGVSEKGDRRFVLTIAATNTPWSIDPAILSRFERKIFIPLPDQMTRKQILELQLLKRGYDLAIPLDLLAEQTEGFSGREIERISKLLVERMIHHANPDLTDVALRGRAAVEAYRVRIRPISVTDVEAVLRSVGPETSTALLDRYKKFSNADH